MKLIELLCVASILAVLAGLTAQTVVRVGKRIKYKAAVIQAFSDARINNALNCEDRKNYDADAGFVGEFDFNWHLNHP